jgi:predicted TPR repeat methyltransferase
LCVVVEDAGDIDKALECYRKALSLIFDDEPAAELDVPLAGAGASPDVADEPPPS